MNITEKSADIERKAKRSKEVVGKSVQQRRCKVRMPMIGRLKPSDIPPSLPSLGVNKDYVHGGDAGDNIQTTYIFESSVPLDG